MASFKKRNLLHWLSLLTPLFQLALFTWVFYLHRAQALQPSHWPFTILVVLILVGSLTQLSIMLRALWTKRERLRELRWLCIVLLPTLALLWGGLYTHRITSNRIIPANLLTRWMAAAGISLADLELSIRYPVVVHGNRVDMYCPQELPDAQELVRQMDEHIAAMEQKIGRVGTTKARWVRGDILGRTNFQFFGYAMSNYEMPGKDQKPELQYVDRHELAHFVLSQYMNADGAPPFMLIEGWAQAMSQPSETLAVDAWRTRYLNTGVWHLHELTTSPWYHFDRDSVYSIGGAFVDYLIRHYGEKTFCQLYSIANEQHFAQQFQQAYHKSLLEIEPEFWAEVETLTTERDKKNDAWIDRNVYDQDGGQTIWLDLVQNVNANSQAHTISEDRLHIRSESVHEYRKESQAYRDVNEFWSHNNALWSRAERSMNDQITAEDAIHVSKSAAFALQRSDGSGAWHFNPDYVVSDLKTRIGWLKPIVSGPLHECQRIENLAQWLDRSSLFRFAIENVQEVFVDDNQSLIELDLRLKPNRGDDSKRILLRLDQDYRVISSRYDVVLYNGERKIDDVTYTWQHHLGKTRLMQRAIDRKSLDGQIEETSRTDWTYEICDDKDFPPFRESDFTVSYSWSETFPEVTLDNAAMVLTGLDAFTLCVTSLAMICFRRSGTSNTSISP